MEASRVRVALDLDGVLADLNAQMLRQTRYTAEDFKTFGEWDDFEHFYSEAGRVWQKHWHEIEPVEPQLGLKVEQLASNHTVDIVTNTAGEDRYAKAWLQSHDIPYEDFVRPPEDGYKDAMDYDVFIDDNPYLCGDVPVQYLRHQPWNDRERGNGQYIYHSYERSYVDSEGLPTGHFDNETPWVVRVTGLSDVLYDLDGRE